MQHTIQIKWKDTRKYKDVKYRKQTIKRFNGGWVVETLSDNNIYHCIECAENSIDEQLKGKTRKDASRRHEHGIQTIGKVE